MPSIVKSNVNRALPALIAAAALTPGIATADPFRPSMNDQVKLGREAAAQVRKEERVLPATDPRVIEVRRIAQRVMRAIPADRLRGKPFQFTFDVIESKELNAFALPGGPIFLYSGLLDKMTTEDQIAGVLAHEIVHILNQHWASQYADNMKRQFGLAILLGVMDAPNIVWDLASIGDAVFSLGYSRRHETEADNVGYDFMTAAGFNPQGMVGLFEIILKEGGRDNAPEWIKTHPDTTRRIENLKRRISQERRTFPAERARSGATTKNG